MSDSSARSTFPTTLHHRHGLVDWWPMLPERSAETIDPERGPTERFYRCQFVGCDAVVRIDAAELRGAEADPYR